MLQPQDQPFLLNNPFFVPDKRCEGWYATNIVGFTGFHESVSLESSQNEHKLLTRNVQDFLNVYYRYRIYKNDDGILNFSVRQEHVNQINNKLYNFRLQAPKPKDFECMNIADENAPLYRNLFDELTDMLHNYDLKKDLVPTAKSPEEIAKFNFVADMVYCNRERVILEYREQSGKDMFIKKIIRAMFENVCKCKPDCMWNCYQNIWVFQEMFEKLGSRSEKQKQKDFGPLFVMSKKVFDKRKSGSAREAYLKAMEKHFETYQFVDSHVPVLVDEKNDNTPIPNIDVIHGRGLWLSHSRTYHNWPAQSVKNGKTKSEVPQADALDDIQKGPPSEKAENSKGTDMAKKDEIDPTNGEQTDQIVTEDGVEVIIIS